LEAHDQPAAPAAIADPADALLDVSGLQVSYGRRPVLFDLSLKVGPGEIVAMFGHNGAGKTTTLNAIFGRVKPAGGSIHFVGQDTTSWNGVAHVKAGITLIPAERFVFTDLTVIDNLRLGSYHEGNRATVDSRLEQVYETFPILKERAGQLAGTFSGGQQRMLSIGIAMMTGPKLLLLDEPSLGVVDRAYFVRSGRVILEERSEQLRERGSYWDLF
jgi:branched-chain amino acid transport system ATP-binding protein